jgi:hypothetical protein
MVEEVKLIDLAKKYKVVTGRRPKKKDLVFVPSQQAIFEVINVESMTVKIERKQKGSGLFMVLPPSQYKIIEKK